MEQPCSSSGSILDGSDSPAIEPDTLCFFAGTVSARQTNRKAYLIDGVAINGVSGGPVFHSPTPDEVQIIGCVSAYHANRATGETLPGLLRGAVTYPIFMESRNSYRPADEANEKKREVEASQQSPRELDAAGSAESDPGVTETVPVLRKIDEPN